MRRRLWTAGRHPKKPVVLSNSNVFVHYAARNRTQSEAQNGALNSSRSRSKLLVLLALQIASIGQGRAGVKGWKECFQFLGKSSTAIVENFRRGASTRLTPVI